MPRVFGKIRSRSIIRRASDRAQSRIPSSLSHLDNTKTIITQDKHTKGPEPIIQDMQGCISGGNYIMCKGANDFWFRQFSYLRVFLPIFFQFFTTQRFESHVQGCVSTPIMLHTYLIHIHPRLYN